MKFAIYIPNYNGADFLRSVRLPRGVDVVVLDNASDDDSESVCLDRGFYYIRSDVNVGRVPNWLRCISHFKDSDYDWMKWLFVGDELSNDFCSIVNESILEAGDSSCIIYNYFINDGNQKKAWSRSTKEKKELTHTQLAEKIFLDGNVLGSPIGLMISKRAALDVCLESPFVWVADLWITYKLSENGNILFWPESIGTFNAGKRSIYKSQGGAFFSIVEQLELLRRIALEKNMQSNRMPSIFLIKLFLRGGKALTGALVLHMLTKIKFYNIKSDS